MAAKRPGDSTGIEWTHFLGFAGATWNPIVGCTRVSPGCDNCYAFQLHDQRYNANVNAARAALAPLPPDPRYASGRFVLAAAREQGVALPFPVQFDKPFSTVQVLGDDRLFEPLYKTRPQCYFVDSMNDLFHEDIPLDALDRVFAVMSVTPRHRYLILTKRPERMRDYLNDPETPKRIIQAIGDLVVPGYIVRRIALENAATGFRWPIPNVGVGATMESQELVDVRAPVLLATMASMHFVSIEPLLERVSIADWLPRTVTGWSELHGEQDADVPGFDWVIVGGESGPRVRPMDDDWARQIGAECYAREVPFFYKQPSGSRPGQHGPPDLESSKQFPDFFVA